MLSGASSHFIGYEADFILDVSKPGFYTIVSESNTLPAE